MAKAKAIESDYVEGAAPDDIKNLDRAAAGETFSVGRDTYRPTRVDEAALLRLPSGGKLLCVRWNPRWHDKEFGPHARTQAKWWPALRLDEQEIGKHVVRVGRPFVMPLKTEWIAHLKNAFHPLAPGDSLRSYLSADKRVVAEPVELDAAVVKIHNKSMCFLHVKHCGLWGFGGKWHAASPEIKVADPN